MTYSEILILRANIEKAINSGNIKEGKDLLVQFPQVIEAEQKDHMTLFLVIVIRQEQGNANKRLKMLELLLDAGIGINVSNRYRETALHLAIQHQNFAIATFLIKQGADVQLTTFSGKTALEIAISALDGAISIMDYNNYINLIKLLIKKDTNINRQNIEGKTALHHAVSNHDRDTAIRTAELFLNKSVNFNLRDERGQWALQTAIQQHGILNVERGSRFFFSAAAFAPMNFWLTEKSPLSLRNNNNNNNEEVTPAVIWKHNMTTAIKLDKAAYEDEQGSVSANISAYSYRTANVPEQDELLTKSRRRRRV